MEREAFLVDVLGDRLTIEQVVGQMVRFYGVTKIPRYKMRRWLEKRT